VSCGRWLTATHAGRNSSIGLNDEVVNKVGGGGGGGLVVVGGGAGGGGVGWGGEGGGGSGFGINCATWTRKRRVGSRHSVTCDQGLPPPMGGVFDKKNGGHIKSLISHRRAQTSP